MAACPPPVFIKPLQWYKNMELVLAPSDPLWDAPITICEELRTVSTPRKLAWLSSQLAPTDRLQSEDVSFFTFDEHYVVSHLDGHAGPVCAMRGLQMGWTMIARRAANAAYVEIICGELSPADVRNETRGYVDVTPRDPLSIPIPIPIPIPHNARARTFDTSLRSNKLMSWPERFIVLLSAIFCFFCFAVFVQACRHYNRCTSRGAQ